MNNGGLMTSTILQTTKRSAAAVVVGLACAITLTAGAKAATQVSGAIAQGFKADSANGEIVPGSLVSAKAGDPHGVQLATNDPSSHLIGVADKNPLVVISTSEKEVQVVIGGTTNVLVSDINGTVRAGDKIAASPINGVGMKATTDSQVIGMAQTDFDSSKADTQTVTDKKGKNHTVRIGYLPLQVGIALYRAPSSDFVPPFIQNIANSVAGRPVSLIRLLVCSVLLLIGLVTAVVLVYGAVRSAMTSLGRNPLAAGAIRKSMYQIVGVALTVLGCSLVACYVILSV
ncbi:MAG TPA: hypothetical protein VL737_00365 [Candidatus Pristimantibacillus sp.]|nr:hypothetical protein [Candidatus Pristimantibacillus sp.]